MTRPRPTADASSAPPDGDRVATAPAPDASVAATRRYHLDEDWLATLVGLVLLGLVLTGVIGAGVVP